MKLETIVIKGIEYTFIEKFTELEDIGDIYYFAGDENDIFCLKADDNYIQITDEEIISRIKKYYDLYPKDIWFLIPVLSKIFTLDSEISNVNKFDEEAKLNALKTVLNDLSHTSFESTDYFYHRLKGVDYYAANVHSEKFVACYHPSSNSVFIDNKDYAKFDSLDAKRTFLHETIHAITGSINLLINLSLNSGFIEGATESLVEDTYGNQYSNGLYNLSEGCSYPNNVSLVRQMEVLLRKEIISFSFKGR